MRVSAVGTTHSVPGVPKFLFRKFSPPEPDFPAPSGFAAGIFHTFLYASPPHS